MQVPDRACAIHYSSAGAEAISEAHAQQYRIDADSRDLVAVELHIGSQHDPLGIGVEIPMPGDLVIEAGLYRGAHARMVKGQSPDPGHLKIRVHDRCYVQPRNLTSNSSACTAGATGAKIIATKQAALTPLFLRFAVTIDPLLMLKAQVAPDAHRSEAESVEGRLAASTRGNHEKPALSGPCAGCDGFAASAPRACDCSEKEFQR
jgi:hypothetical protein